MDVVLEVTDSFIGDHFFSWVLPARPAPYDYPNVPTNSTDQVFSTWHYKPSTHFFSIEPSQAAYMSSWPRDNIYRQAISLFLITWLVPPFSNPDSHLLHVADLMRLSGSLVLLCILYSRHSVTSLSLTRIPRTTPNTSRIRYGWRSSRLTRPCPEWPYAHYRSS